MNGNALPYSSFSGLQSTRLFHGVFNRHGGTGEGRFGSLNVSYHVGDQPEQVATNRERLKQAFGVDRLVSARQVHAAEVFVLHERPSADFEADGFDAIITQVPGVALMIQQADCQAVLLFDPDKRVVGIAHAGWRGSVVNILAATVQAMTDNFASQAKDLKAAISPSLGPCCAEFVNHHQELPAAFASFQTRPNYFDFWAVSRSQLIAAGVKPANIEAAEICTVCDANYFSYRRERVTGRFASVIGLT